MTDFARTLERELATANEQLAALKEEGNALRHERATALRERDEWMRRSTESARARDSFAYPPHTKLPLDEVWALSTDQGIPLPQYIAGFFHPRWREIRESFEALLQERDEAREMNVIVSAFRDALEKERDTATTSRDAEFEAHRMTQCERDRLAAELKEAKTTICTLQALAQEAQREHDKERKYLLAIYEQSKRDAIDSYQHAEAEAAGHDEARRELTKAKALIVEYKEQFGCPLCADLQADLDRLSAELKEAKQRIINLEYSNEEHRKTAELWRGTAIERDQLLAQLDQSKREAAAMRTALELCHKKAFPLCKQSEHHINVPAHAICDAAAKALSSTAGQDFIPRADYEYAMDCLKARDSKITLLITDRAALTAEHEKLRILAYMPDQDGDQSNTLWSKEADDWYKHAVKLTDERDELKADYNRRGAVLTKCVEALGDLLMHGVMDQSGQQYDADPDKASAALTAAREEIRAGASR